MTDRKLLFLPVIALGLCLLLAGCGGGQGNEGEPKGHLVAGGIGDGASPAAAAQAECPVCGSPIKAEFYADTDNGRVYFDKKECVQQWMDNPDAYRDKLEEQKQPPLH
jgi:YHS domain-containing protein